MQTRLINLVFFFPIHSIHISSNNDDIQEKPVNRSNNKLFSPEKNHPLYGCGFSELENAEFAITNLVPFFSSNFQFDLVFCTFSDRL